MVALQVIEAVAGLSTRTEGRRLAALSDLRSDQQANLGQFFTPARAAELVAKMPRLPETGQLRILDPGAGSGSLTAAITSRVMLESPGLEVEVVAVEVDPDVASCLQRTLDDIVWTARHVGTTVTYKLVVGDYIDLCSGLLDSSDDLHDSFDIVIMNPPYRKLGLSSSYRKAMLSQGADCANLYAAFLALGTSALRSGGQLVAITPRSFANGPYFGQFRKFLLDRVALDRLHVFESRSTVFADTGVLQENVIFSATRGADKKMVTLSVSRGHMDEAFERVVPYHDVVKPGDEQRFIRIAAGDEDTAVADTMAAMPETLADLHLNVSTGRVVDFRSRECLMKQPVLGSVPLIYPANVRSGLIEWPREIRKDQAFAARSPGDEKLLMPSGYYVVVKRFSSKEERRRVVAAVWDPTMHDGPIAFENHLNVFHADGVGLDRDLAVGLSYWLNSSTVDSFFRTFSGHTQVNATDLRSLRFPAGNVLRAAGKVLDAQLPVQEVIDACVERLVQLADSAVA